MGELGAVGPGAPVALESLSCRVRRDPSGLCVGSEQHGGGCLHSALALAVSAASDTLCLLSQFGLSLLLLVLSRGEDLQSSDAASESTQSNPWSVWAVFLL